MNLLSTQNNRVLYIHFQIMSRISMQRIHHFVIFCGKMCCLLETFSILINFSSQWSWRGNKSKQRAETTKFLKYSTSIFIHPKKRVMSFAQFRLPYKEYINSKHNYLDILHHVVNIDRLYMTVIAIYWYSL